jgi:2-polyprenyl-3-methyl-5-hydroxy-6-metoxy-1,4-benzoquinol methylase
MITIPEKKLWFRKIKNSPIQSKDEIIMQLCTNKKVLDVGCVGQDSPYQSENWLHNKLKKVSREITGVDIDFESIEYLKKVGHNIIHVNELENYNEKYDVIVMADVIEHVNDPVDFIKFYSRYLNQEGIFLITTPNATRIRTFIEILFTTTYSMNFEHICWFCPKTLLEVISRADLIPVDFYWLKEYSPKLRYLIYNPLLRIWKNYNPNFLFVCKNEKKS